MEHHPAHQKVADSISLWGVYGRQPIDVSHIDVPFPLSKINKHVLGKGLKKIKLGFYPSIETEWKIGVLSFWMITFQRDDF